jgi:hypothetical protein
MISLNPRLALVVCLWLSLEGTVRGDSQEAPSVKVDGLGDSLPVGAVARLGTHRFRHELALTTAACTPDGKVIIAGGMRAS